MKVLERWREMQQDPVYCNLFRDGELLELSESLFGTVPGARDFVSACMTKSGSRNAMSGFEFNSGA